MELKNIELKKGVVSYKNNNFEEAIQYFSQAIQKDNKNSKAFLYRAYSYLKIKQKNKATEDILISAELENEKAIELASKLNLEINESAQIFDFDSDGDKTDSSVQNDKYFPSQQPPHSNKEKDSSILKGIFYIVGIIIFIVLLVKGGCFEKFVEVMDYQYAENIVNECLSTTSKIEVADKYSKLISKKEAKRIVYLYAGVPDPYISSKIKKHILVYFRHGKDGEYYFNCLTSIYYLDYYPSESEIENFKESCGYYEYSSMQDNSNSDNATSKSKQDDFYYVKDYMYYKQKGDSLIYLGENDNALVYLEKGLSLDLNSEQKSTIYESIAFLQLQKYELSEAIKNADLAIRYSSESYTAMVVKANALFLQTDKTNDSIDILKNLLRRQPNFNDAYLTYCKLMMIENQSTAKVTELLTKVVEDNRSIFSKAEACLCLAYITKSNEWMKKGIELYPDIKNNLKARAINLEHKGNSQMASLYLKLAKDF